MKKRGTSQTLVFFHKLLLPPIRKPDKIMMDNSKEFVKAWQDLQWNHDTSTPHRSETNGVAERTFRVAHWTTGGIVRCNAAVTCGILQDRMADRQAAHKKTIVKSSDRPIIPFGSVEYLLNSAKDKSKTSVWKRHCKGSRQELSLYCGTSWSPLADCRDSHTSQDSKSKEVFVKTSMRFSLCWRDQQNS